MITAAVLVALLFSAYMVGSNYMPGGSPMTPSGLSYMRSSGGEMVTLTSGASDAVTAAAAAEAVSVAADSAKAASASPLTVLFGVGSNGEAEYDVGNVGLYAERLVVFTARLELEVEDVEATVDAVRLLAESHGGFVSTVNTRDKRGSITVRVPQRRFHDAVEEIEELGEVQSRNLQGEDVTEEYVDLQAELTNMERQEQRLLDIMEMGTTVESVLKVEHELERVRGRIESLQGRINYLDSRVELATITVNLNLEPEEEPEMHLAWFPEVDWGEPVKAGLSVLFTVTQGMITMVIVLGPFAAVGYGGFKAYRYFRSRRTPEIETVT
jgi:hypothetical protein